MSDAEGLWRSCTDILRSQVNDAVWFSTFSALTPVAFDGQLLTLVAPSMMLRERLEARWAGLVKDTLREVHGSELDIHVVVIEQRRDELPGLDLINAAGTPTDTMSALPGYRTGAPGQPGTISSESVGRELDGDDVHTLGNGRDAIAGSDQGVTGDTSGLNPKYAFDTFVIGQSNRFAHAAALGVAERPAEHYNPLFIYGKAGLGKTHLIQAIGFFVRQTYPNKRVRYLSTETFMNEFVQSIRSNSSNEFKRRYRQVDVLLVDDVQFMEGKEGLQEEFFHTFNELHQTDRQIVLTSDRQPDSMKTLEDRLRSRFKSGLITDIQPPDLETRLAILHTKAASSPIHVPDDVLNFVAENIKDNIRELEGALIRLIAWSNLSDQPLTMECTHDLLAGTLARNEPLIVTPPMIIKATCAMHHISDEDLLGRSRRRPLVNARQVAMYVMRELTDLSYPAIGREFGGRDHTTVMHAVEKITNLMNERKTIFDSVNRLIISIRNGDYA